MKNTSLKRLFYTLAAVFALPAAALAVDPVAVWDGNFSDGVLSQNGYTLDLCGNTRSQDASAITISQSVGVKIVADGTFASGFTVMFKYSGLTLSLAEKQVLATSILTDADDRTGVSIDKTGKSCGIWNGSSWNKSGTYNSMTASQTSGTLGFSHYSTTKYSGTGTKLFDISGSTATTILDAGELGSDGDKAKYNGAAIGGRSTAASGFSAATGMKITAIAVFSGILTESEMTGYIWPDEYQDVAVGSDTSVSAINGQLSPSSRVLNLTVADDVTIAVDEAFAIQTYVASAGRIKLSAASQPNLSNVDFTGVSGAVLRSWLTPGVVGINFVPDYGNDTSTALVSGETWISSSNWHDGAESDSSNGLFADGLSTLKWSAAAVYAYTGTSSILGGYIDDGLNNGKGAEITLSCVPYNSYDVIIYASTDTKNTQFLPKTVNGVSYTWDDVQGKTVVGSSNWGASRNNVPTYGVNAICVSNLFGALSISGGVKNGNIRGGIAAIQIVPAKESFLTLNGGSATWSGSAWADGAGAAIAAPTDGSVTIDVNASTTLTIDKTISAATIEVRGSVDAVLTLVANGGSLDAKEVRVKGCVLQQGSAAVLGSTAKIYVANGGTFDMGGYGAGSSSVFYLAGAGTGNWPYALTSSSNMSSGYVKEINLMANATVGGNSKILFGKTGVANFLYMNGHVLTKAGTGEFFCYNSRTRNGVLDIAGGTFSCNEYTNLGGWETIDDRPTVIVRSGATLLNNNDRHHWIGTLQLLGGTLATASGAFGVADAFEGSGTTAKLRFADGATATLSGDTTIASELTLGPKGSDSGALSIFKAESAVAPVAFTVSGAFASAGFVSVGPGITLNLGVNRPTTVFAVDADSTISLQKTDVSDVPQINVSAQPANIVLYDENGDVVASPTVVYDSKKGTLALITENTWTAKSGTEFDTAANWSTGLPSNGDSVTIQATADTEITVTGAYTLDTLTISGPWQVSFAGSGSITAANIHVKNGAKLLRNGAANVNASIALDAGAKLLIDSTTENAEISGAGSVETYGNVTMAAANTFTGGITAKTGTLSTTTASGFGKDNTGSAYSALSRVTVENGACVDLNNTKDHCFALTIEGKGVLQANGTYSGAVKNTGIAMGNNARQTASLTLTADATVDVTSGWGIVQSEYNAAYLALNGHTLTFKGGGTVPLVNVNASNSSGMIVLDGANLQLSNVASDFTGVNIVARGCPTINIAIAPSAIGALVIEPTVGGTTATAWSMPSGFVPEVNAANIAPGEVAKLGTATLFTAPSSVELSDSTIHTYVGGRYSATVSSSTVSVTEKAVTPFIHYDFNAANSIAADSPYNFGNLNPTFKPGRNGRAGWFKSGTTPYWDSNTSGLAPAYAGQMTVTTLLKPKEADSTIIWNFGSGWGTGIAIVAKDSSTLALVSWTGGANGADMVSVTGINKLTTRWHLVTVVADANGTTLYVDDQSATTDAVLPLGISAQGQFGSIHGTAKNYKAVADSGFYLDDWCLYDAALTPAEVRSIYLTMLPQLRLILR